MLLAAPRVAVSIAPVHSLVQGLMAGVASAELLIGNGQSPHGASLSPSAVRAVGLADLVVWVGPALEYPLASLMQQVDANKKITLMDLPQMLILPVRASGLMAAAGQPQHGHGHAHSSDPHLWLATSNAATLVASVGDWLIRFDPQHQAIYRANSRRLLARIEQTRQQIDTELAPIRGKKWIVFHDAYQYFESEFGLAPVATVTINPQQPLGAKTIKLLKQQVRSAGVECVFTEPQFNTAVVATIVENTAARVGVLDPVGSQIAIGMAHWFMTMRQMSEAMTECLHNRL